MGTVNREISLGFTDEHVHEGTHICYIYSDEQERREVMSKYLQSGLLAREKVLALVDDISQRDMIERLRAADMPADALTVLESVHGYCPSGKFDADQTLNLIRDFYRQAVDTEGYAGARGTGQMGWSIDHGRANIRDLIEYEARVNSLLDEHPYTACCQYDARMFSGEVIMDILSVHPIMIVRGQLVKNPFYVEPKVFLEHYRERT